MIDAESKLFAWPIHAEIGRRLNKDRFYAGVRNNRRLKELFTQQVARVTWSYKLASSTLSIPATAEVPEIEVIQVEVNGSELDPAVLVAIDRAIPNPTIHEIQLGSSVQQTAAFKRTSEADSRGWVISHYVASPFQPADFARQTLPQSLNLGNLYASLLRSMIDVPALDGESLRGQVERHGEVMAYRREAQRLTKRINTEKQFNRRVELNSRLRDVNQTISRLTNGVGAEN